MNLQYIKEFLAIVESKNYTLAAEKLYISQSSLSKHIKTLENSFGFPLFDRTTRSVELSREAQQILPLCRELNEQYTQLQKQIEELNDSRKKLRITSIPVMAQYGITTAIAEFLKKEPNVDLTFLENESVKINRSLIDNQFDLAFIRSINNDSKLFDSIPFTTDSVIVIVNQNHRLSNFESVSLKDLVDEKLILFNQSTLLYDYVIDLFEKNNLRPNVTQTANRPENIIDLVEQDLGISILFKKQVSYRESLNVISLELKPETKSEIILIKRRGQQLSTASHLFWKYIEDKVKT